MADELRRLAADLSQVATGVRPFAEKAVEVTARRIKDDWRAGAERTGLHGYAASIDYERTSGIRDVSAVVGPKTGGQGSLGIMEDAPGGVKSAPQHAGRDALEANEADFYDGLAKAATDALLKGLGG